MENESNVVKQYALMCCNSKVFSYQQTQIMKNAKGFFGERKAM